MPGAPNYSRARLRMFIAAVFIGLGSGSNYVYSGYAPQLAAKLAITSTDANLVGVGGNLGMYLCGPIWGLVTDRHGPRIPLMCGALLNFTGYMFVRLFYLGVFPIRSAPDEPASRLRVLLLAASLFLTGTGGSAGLTAAMNGVARSFPDRTRASATGSVLAGFGLSAFLFSTAGHLLYHGEAGGLLLLLAIGTALPDLVGSFIVRPYPPDEHGHDTDTLRDADLEDMDDEAECALARQASLGVSPEGPWEFEAAHEAAERERSDRAVELDTDEQEGQTAPLLRRPRRKRADSLTSLPPTALHYTPFEAFHTLDFNLLFVTLATLCGIGLMWINNVGAVTLALARDGWSYDQRSVAALQAKQVATISVFNCSGRVLAGLLSDAFKIRLGLKRIWFLPIVALMFLGSELSVLNTTNAKHLWRVSAFLGLAYGSLFNVVPMLVLEWFGMTHFSQNFGWMSVGPIIGGNIFNMLFGRIYDSNTVGRVGAPESVGEADSAAGAHKAVAGVLDLASVVRGLIRRADAAGEHECLAGRGCYSAAFRVTAAACVFAFGLSVYAGVRRERQSAERKRLIRLERARGEAA